MERSLERAIERWLEAGLLTGVQVRAIRDFENGAPPAEAAPSAEGPQSPRRRRRRASDAPGVQLPAFLQLAVDPPFARNPPFYVNARVVGFATAALAALALFAALVTGTTDLLLAPGRLPKEIIALVLQLGAGALGLAGGYLMLTRRARGKPLVVASLAVDIIGNAIPDPRHFLHWDAVLQLVFWLLLYYLVVISRYQRLAAAA